jgi:outer membrane immunogenic protein
MRKIRFGSGPAAHKVVVAAAAIAMLAGTQAFAADLAAPAYKTPPAPITASSYSWTGCYIGGNAGGGRSINEWQPFAGTWLDTARASGFFGGGQIGCDYQAGPWVFGLVGTFDYAGMHSAALSGINQVQTRLDAFAIGAGRIGYSFDRVLTYVKGGLAWARFENEFDVSLGAPAFVPFLRGNDSAVGFDLGAGFEVAILPNVSVSAEYNYLAFGTSNVAMTCQPASGGCAGAPANVPVDIKQTVQTVMFGLNYRFGLQ